MSRRARRPATALALALAMGVSGLSGCAAFSEDSASGAAGSGGTGESGRVSVVVGLYPLQFLAERVGGDDVTVADLTSPGQEPHDLELSPAQVAQVEDADVVLYEQGLQASVDAALAQAPSGTGLDVGPVAGLEPIGHDGHDASDPDEQHEQHEQHEEGGSGDLDPHFWQDPLKMAAVAEALADRLSEVDPEHAADYAARAAALDADLRDLDTAYAEGLADCARDTVVVSHDAFGYLSRYGLDFEPISGLSPDAEPTPADLARLQQVIEEDGITTVFGERLVSPALSRTLADDMGITAAVLDPVEGLTDETADQDYLSLMRGNLAALQAANGCS